MLFDAEWVSVVEREKLPVLAYILGSGYNTSISSDLFTEKFLCSLVHNCGTNIQKNLCRSVIKIVPEKMRGDCGEEKWGSCVEILSFY